MNYKVTILLSTYNGEKYIKEQIDSILNQSYNNIQLLVRDDGSSDRTLSILENYSKIDARVTFYKGDNKGVAKSFFDLVQNAPDSDYYAFCDQDDIWDDKKIQVAVDYLSRQPADIPVLYLSNQKIVDNDMNIMDYRLHSPVSKVSKYTSLVEFIAVGCTEVFNKKALEITRNNLTEYNVMHDAWVYILCSFTGLIFYDFNAYINYRQHDNNVIGYKTNLISRIKDKTLRLLNRQLQPRLTYAKALLSVGNSFLSHEEITKVSKIINYKKNIYNRLSLLFDFDIRASSFARDFRYRMLIIYGAI